jgi:UDP-N-acetylmuramoylalanine--D-glutamate ligase
MAWLVFGSGVSGIAAAELLASRGEHVTVVDQKPLDSATKDRLTGAGIRKIIDSDICNLDLNPFSQCVLSPGIALSDPLVAKLRGRGTEIISEIDLGLGGFLGQVIGVTGTNGKSTTVSMIHHVLSAGGIENSLAGNIGVPPSALVKENNLRDIVILELSSYQLEQSHRIPCKFAAITSFTPDHLGRHGDLRSYFMAKWKILDGANQNCLFMLSPAAHDRVREYGLSTKGLLVEIIDERLCDTYGITEAATGISLRHNRLNGVVAVRAAMHVGQMNLQDCVGALRSFQGLEHRFEFVASVAGRKVFNDSKATNVASTIVALESLKTPCLLMLGGQGKGESFRPIIDFKSKIAGVVAFGSSRREIVRDLGPELPLMQFATLKEAFAGFRQILDFCGGDIVFSPACASFDEFRNFEDRGTIFKNFIRSFR